MGTFNININNINRKNTKKKKEEKQKEKIILTYHSCIKEIPEYYTYFDSENNEQIFTDKTYIINKISSSKYVARKNNVNKIMLTYVPSKQTIDFKPSYFTYNDNKIYLDKPIYNKETNTYNGVLKDIVLYNEKVNIYEEK